MLEDVNVVDVRAGEVVSSLDVLVDEGVVVAVIPHGDERVRAETVVALDGGYVVPGLWDMHAHLRTYEGQDVLPMFLAHGITGIRDLGLTDFRLVRRWERESARGALWGPRIVSSGVIVEGATPRFASSLSVTAVDQITPALDSLVEQGVEIIKLFQNLQGPVYEALVTYAVDRGLQSAGHIPTEWDQVRGAEAGLGSIEHFWGMSNTVSVSDGSPSSEDLDRLASALLAAGTFQSPTLVNNPLTAEALFGDDESLAYTPAYHRAWWSRLSEGLVAGMTPADSQALRAAASLDRVIAGELARRGVKFLAGTDTPNPYLPAGLSLHAELRAFVESGMTPAEALRTATVYPAEYFRREGQWGAVDEGYEADLVLLAASPLEDIANTQRVVGVVTRGRYLSLEAIEDLKRAHRIRLATRSAEDLDQAIYMEVRRNGVEGAKRLYPDPLREGDLVAQPPHLLRLGQLLVESGLPDQARQALEWNLELFPGDAATVVALEALPDSRPPT